MKKLSKEETKQIKALYKNGQTLFGLKEPLTQTALSKMFKCSQQRVSEIVRG